MRSFHIWIGSEPRIYQKLHAKSAIEKIDSWIPNLTFPQPHYVVAWATRQLNWFFFGSFSAPTKLIGIPFFVFNFSHTDNWSEKGKRRKTTGTGRCRYLKIVRRRFRNGFREGGQAKPQKKNTKA